MTENRRVKLSSSTKGSASWVYMSDAGDLIVEKYDYDQMAEDSFGNDVAFLLTIPAKQKQRMLDLLRTPVVGHGSGADQDDLLLDLMAQRFHSYFEIQEWLDSKDVRYDKKFDSHA
jgi:hypothetical protein